MSEVDYTHILSEMEESERESFMAKVFDKIKTIKKCEISYYEFAKQAWPQIEGQTFRDNWHIGAICEHLEACSKRQIKKLLINIPPRFMKSTLVGVMWPAWTWINIAHEKFLYASYAASLSFRDSVNCRRLISSPWYQERWGNKFNLTGDQNTKGRFNNDRGGYRIASSVESSLTGEGGSIRVLDDPNNTNQISDLILDGTIFWLTSTWFTRKNDPENDVLVIIQQRMNEKDVSGYILEKDTENEWVKLILPMEFEEGRRSKTVVLPSSENQVWQDPRNYEGELLWPNFWNEDKVEEGKRELGNEYAVAGQYQQRPAPMGGGFIKKDWFKIWKDERPPHLDYVIQSWDTAFSIKDASDYSACVTMGVFYDHLKIPNVILLNAWRGRVDYPDLRKLAQEFYRDYRSKSIGSIDPDGHHRPSMVLIEDKGSGMSLVQDFRKAGVPVIGFDPRKHGDKITRVQKISHLIQAGRIWVAAIPPTYKHLRQSAQLLVDCCTMFPAGKSRDIVDAMTQILIRLNLSGWINNPYDEDSGDTSLRMKKVFY
jgi:predicted phage terminase large subunit-like protein